jgi:heptosyltransferase I
MLPAGSITVTDPAIQPNLDNRVETGNHSLTPVISGIPQLVSSAANPPQSICLIRLSAIGDCCQLVPAVRAMQSAWPDTALTWIIGRTEASLLGDLDGVEMISYRKGGGLAAWRELHRNLSNRRFDALLLMQVSLRAALVSTAVRAESRIGFDADRARTGHGFFINRRIAPHPQAHVLEGFFDFLHALGIDQRGLRWDIPVPAAARERALALIPDGQPSLVISPCSSRRFNNYRNWPAESYAHVVRHAHERYGLVTVLTGGSSDEERRYGDTISRLASVAAVEDCIGRTSLKELLAILQRAEAVICPDSGPAHIATAVGTPVIGLYATSNPARTGPYLSQRWVVNRYPDAVRKTWGCAPDDVRWGRRVRDPAAMDLVTVEDVLRQLDALLAVPRESRLPPPVLVHPPL